MPVRSIRVRVWCEDARHENFIRLLLKKIFRIDRRNITVEKAPAGQGAASQWVTCRYRDKVLASCRRCRSQQMLYFLVMIDGDNVGFRGRLDTLETDRQDIVDRLVRLIPTWSIETWVLWLTGNQTVTETESFKNDLRQSEFSIILQTAIDAWENVRAQEATAVPSPAAARNELARLLTN